jgi:nitrile hydratase
MNGAHDMGGMDGFGPVVAEPNEPVFHAEWERRTFAMTVAMGFYGAWNIDMSRYARERMEPGAYLTTSYYEHWLHGLETLLVEKGLVSAEELEARRAELAKKG